MQLRGKAQVGLEQSKNGARYGKTSKNHWHPMGEPQLSEAAGGPASPVFKPCPHEVETNFNKELGQ